MKELLLRVKIKSLTEECKIIRNEEKLSKWKAKAATARSKQEQAKKHLSHYSSLDIHRRVDLRKEARATYLAYGFLRGKSMRDIEHFSYVQPDWERIERMVMKYFDGDVRDINQRFAAWKDEALAGINCIQRGGVELMHGAVILNPTPHSVKEVSMWLTREFVSYTEFLEFKNSLNPIRPNVKKNFLNGGTDSMFGMSEAD